MTHQRLFAQLAAYVVLVAATIFSVNKLQSSQTHSLHESQIAACGRGNNLRKQLNNRTDHIDAIALNLNTLVATLEKNGTLPKQTAAEVIKADKSEKLPQFTIINCAKDFPNP